MILLSPCQYDSMKREIEILKNEKLKLQPTQTETEVKSHPNVISQNPTNTQASLSSSLGASVLPQTDNSNTSSSKPNIDQVVSILPTNIRNKGKLLLSHIDQSACLTWDSLLHIVIEGQVLNRSNIADLLKYVLQTGRAPSFTPNNLIEFLCCLKKANVPQTLLNATARKKLLTIKTDDVSKISTAVGGGGGGGGGGGDSSTADLSLDTFSLPPPGLKSLQNKDKRKKSFVWLDY